MKSINGYLLSAIFLLFSQSAHAAISVDCDAGDSLQAAIDTATEGVTISIIGTCYLSSPIIITVDGLVLKSGTNAYASIKNTGGRDVIVVDGAQRVRLEGLNIEEFSGVALRAKANATISISFTRIRYGETGITLETGAHAVMYFVSVDSNSRTGVVVSGGSILEANEVSVFNNGMHGISLSENSNATLGGFNGIGFNGATGLEVTRGSILRFEGDGIIDSNNGTVGKTEGVDIAVSYLSIIDLGNGPTSFGTAVCDKTSLAFNASQSPYQIMCNK